MSQESCHEFDLGIAYPAPTTHEYEFRITAGLDPAKQAGPPNGGSLWISVLVRWDRLAPGSCSGAKGVLGSLRWLLRRRIFLAV